MKILGVKIKFLPKEKDDGFLLLPVPAIGYAKIENGFKALAFGLKFGFWGVYAALYIKGKQ